MAKVLIALAIVSLSSLWSSAADAKKRKRNSPNVAVNVAVAVAETTPIAALPTSPSAVYVATPAAVQKPATATATATASATATATARSETKGASKRGFTLGAALHGGGAIGGPLAATLGGTLDLGYRAPFLERTFGFGLVLGVSKAWLPAVAASSGYLIAVSPVLSINYELGKNLIRAQLGPSLRFTRIDIAGDVARTADGTWSFGGLGTLSYFRALGNAGALGVTLSYAVTTYYADNVLFTGHLLSGALAYTFEL
ncbi:MAG: hypothetical protein IT381_06350 [Deltaproteobacteria bacterium]|nr:hypothetical protein [Deltaproteobacteria bacterium]